MKNLLRSTKTEDGCSSEINIANCMSFLLILLFGAENLHALMVNKFEEKNTKMLMNLFNSNYE